MSTKLESEFGVITIDNEVIATVAGMTAIESYGIVGMAAKNVKDGIVHLLKKESLTKGVKIIVAENKATIHLHIIVEYGTNISAIADNIMSNVKYNVEDLVGIEVTAVDVFVEGVRVDS